MIFYKTTCIVLLFFLLELPTHAQQKWSAGLETAMSYNIVKTKFPNDFDPGLGYGIGLNAMHFFNNHLFVNAGVVYNKKSYTLKNLPDTRFLYSNGGYFNQNNIRYYSVTSHLNYLSVPLNIGYSIFDLNNRSFSFFLSGGIQLNYLFLEKGHSEDSEINQLLHHNTDNETFSSSALLGLGFFYNISYRLFLKVAPQYSYDFYNAYNNGAKLHSLSLSAALQYKLEK